MIELNGMVETQFQDETYEGSIGVEFTAKIWYSILPKEVIQEFLMAFSDYKVEMESQLDFYSEGNLEFQELTIVESELDDLSATITARITVAGDFSEGIMAAAESFSTEFDSQVKSIPLEELSFTEVRSSDLHIYYEKEDLAFYLDYEVLIEGDIDEQVNSMKDYFLEELLTDPKLDPDEADMIRDVLLPTKVSVIDLETSFNSTMKDGSASIDFKVDGLILKQLDPEDLLSGLEVVSEEVTNEELTLTIKGASEGNKYVEIGVPEETSMPLTEESDSVSWTFAELENFDEVTFDVKEKPSTLPSTLPSTGYLLPAVGAVVIVALAAGLYFMRRR